MASIREPARRGVERLSPYSTWLLFAELAKGTQHSTIRRRFHLQKWELKEIVEDPQFKENISRCRERILDAITDEFLTKVKPATEELERLTKDESPQIRLAACSKIIDSAVKYKELKYKFQTIKALKETKHENQQSVLDCLPVDKLQHLLQQGAVIKQLDLSQVDAEKLKITLSQLNGPGPSDIPQGQKLGALSRPHT